MGPLFGRFDQNTLQTGGNFSNKEILKEYTEVLHRDKFHLPKNLVDTTIRQIQENGIAAERIHSDETFLDQTDIVFYEVALSKDDAFLVTGNIRHFPKNSRVVTPDEFLKQIQSFQTD